MRIFVTGGSGFVGGEVLRALSSAHETYAMARSPAAEAVVSALGATPVISSLEDVNTDHLSGMDAVVHCAAFVKDWGPEHVFRSSNVDGTSRLLDAARAAAVRRFVHVSTESVLFRGDHLREIDESTPYPHSTPFLYSSTKAEAERMVLAANQPGRGLETVVVRPVLVWGPGDRTVLPELVARARSGQYVWLDGGRHLATPTHVTNLAHGIDLALHNGRPGEIYFIVDGVHLSFREFFTAYAATAGVTLPDRSIPGWLARGLAPLVEGLWKVLRLRSHPPITRLAVALVSREITIVSDKARRELGYEPLLSVEEGLTRLAAESAVDLSE